MAAEHGDHQNSTAGIMIEDISKLAPATNPPSPVLDSFRCRI